MQIPTRLLTNWCGARAAMAVFANADQARTDEAVGRAVVILWPIARWSGL